MSSLNSIYIKTDVLETLLAGAKKKGLKGIELTISIADEGNTYGQNVSGYVSQSKEEREAKKQRYFVGNGNTFWTDGKITVVKKEAQPQAAQSPQEMLDEDDDLPW